LSVASVCADAMFTSKNMIADITHVIAFCEYRFFILYFV